MLRTPVLLSEALLADNVDLCLEHPSGALPPEVSGKVDFPGRDTKWFSTFEVSRSRKRLGVSFPKVETELLARQRQGRTWNLIFSRACSGVPSNTQSGSAKVVRRCIGT